MKKLFIISFFLTVIAATTIGQSYKSIFGQTQTSWNVAFHIMPDWVNTDSLIVSSDTLINGKYYKILTGQYWFNGFLREDTMTGRVWYLNSNGIDEMLVMDLSLNVGDTFFVKQQLYLDSIAIVDSIFYENGNKILVLSSNNSYLIFGTDHFKFIEGIGPDIGVIFQIYQSTVFGGEGTLLLCAYKNYIPSYVNTDPHFYGQCHVLIGDINGQQTDNEKLRIFPNPTTGKIHIDYKAVSPYSIEIFDYIGKRISYSSCISSSTFEIDVTDYSKGYYIIKVKENNGKYAVGRILHL